MARLVTTILGTRFGDANLDGLVDKQDARLLALNWAAADIRSPAIQSTTY